MGISILLSDSKPFYHAGDTVSGVVRLITESELHVQQIAISLRGVAETHIVFVKYLTAQSNFNKNVIFFSKEATLLSGPYTLRTGTHEWPFELSFPFTCEKDESQNFQDKKSLLFNHAVEQPLPPSLNQVKSKKFRTSGNSFGVFYPLKAILTSAGRAFGLKDDEAVINLNLHKLRAEEHPSWSTITQICKFKAHHGEPVPTGRKSSLVDVLRGRRGSTDSTPTSEFSLSARIASTVIIDKPIPIFLTLHYDEPALGAPYDSPPALNNITIKSIAIDLETENIIRCQGSGQQPYYSGCPDSSWSTSIPLDAQLAHPIKLENGYTFDLRALLPNLKIPPSETPTFSSFSIVRLHELKIRVELDCSGEQFTASFTVKRVFVLPEAFRAHRALNSNASPDADVDEEDALVALLVPRRQEGTETGSEDLPPFEVAPDTASLAPRYEERDGLPAYAVEETY